MTQEQKDHIVRITWPLVTLFAILAVFFIGVFALIPRDQPEGRTALLGLLTTSASAVVTVVIQRLSTKIDRNRREDNE